ncbi:AmmeMemoRadiSam system protein A [Ferrimonas marina]|uniref:AMMECR1 domain-containing protein n=1 Tax=Ferrimonas marina TaxID=299255 RepID=A0A1M5VR76_9GAMM|nr:AmmeMemoRadiSam system protein A [Ferrimonas marina]SHH77484.1 hypothetical protein SAMN02745129_2920 [Ferrimonas marina]
MQPSPSTEEQSRWLTTARQAIAAHWQPTGPLLKLDWASHCLDAFVSLHLGSELRGCMGRLDNPQPWQVSLPALAQACAFEDPRFPPLTEAELARGWLEISVLLAKQPCPAHSREALLQALEPQRGLILQQGQRRTLFLPQVWHKLTEQEAFVDALLGKGGWSTAGWPAGMKAWQFDCLVVSEPH